MTSMNHRLLILISAVLLLATNLLAQSPEPVPFISQPLVPTTVAPGSGGLTIIVNGAGFTANSIVHWNGNALTTSFVSANQLTADVLAVDVAGANTAAVAVDNPKVGGGSIRSNIVYFPVATSLASVSMNKTDYTVGVSPDYVAAGDINGDSEADLVVAAFTSNKLSILLGTGVGTFSAGTDVLETAPATVAIADFNGDGAMDLATSNSGVNTVSVRLGNGDGTFQASMPFAINEIPHEILAADLNGDGFLDIAIATEGIAGLTPDSAVSVLLGNGDGTFQARVDYPTQATSAGITAGDFNIDGALDLAVANFGANTVSILLGNGNGTFLAQTTLSTGVQPYDVLAADFTGDDVLDLAVTNYGPATVSIFPGNGNGTFGAAIDTVALAGPNYLSAQDFNVDGTLDLAMTNSTGPSFATIQFGNGDGTFQAPQSFATGTNTFGVASADFDNDGRIDLAATNLGNASVSVFLQVLPAPAVQLSTNNLGFGFQLVTTTSSPMQVTLTNIGAATLTFSSVNTQVAPGNSTPSPDFASGWDSSSICFTSNTLPAGQSCVRNVTFSPTSSGPKTAVVAFNTDAVPSTNYVSLSGTGLSQGVITPSVPNLDFGSHPVGTITTQTFTITNTGAGSMNLQGMTFTGNFALDAGTTTCPNPGPLASSASCDIGIKFSAYFLGSNSGQLLITNDGPGNPFIFALSGTGTAVLFANGEIFLSAGDGTVQRRSASGQLIQILDTQTGEETEGLAFDASGNLYVAAFVDGTVKKFDNTGVLLGDFGSGYSIHPESIIFDAAGNVYVGNVDGDNDVRKFDPAGTPLAQFDVAVEDRGSDWIELAPDQCTLYYTSEGLRILRFDVCANTQLDDFTSSLPGSYAFALRLLPTGGLLVADSEAVHRLDANGNIIKTYTPPCCGVDLFALNLDADGTSFWTADYFTSDVFKFDIASGNLLSQFNAGTPLVSGLVVKGEITAATAPQISLSTGSVNFPGNPLTVNCPTKDVVVTNTGDAALNFTAINITSPFSLAAGTTCSTTSAVAPAGSCVLKVKFSPTVVGTVNSTLTLTSNAVASPHTINLSGTGTPACQLLAKVRSVTVLRGADVQDFAIEDAKPSCSPVELNLTCSVENPAACLLNPAVIAPSGASTLKVSNLRRVGGDALQITVTSTSEFRQATELVTVRFADFAFTKSPDEATVAAGSTASYSLAIRPVNGLSGRLTLACSGAPRGATCAVEPASVTLDGTSLEQVKVKVSTASRAGALPVGGIDFGGWARHAVPLLAVLLGLLAVAAAARRRSPVRTPALQRLILATMMLAMLLWVSCGGGGGSMNLGSSGTPAGTYSLTITGTYSSSTGATPGTLANSTTVTLKVN